MSPTLNERVAVLETKIDHVLAAVEKIAINQSDTRKIVDSLNSKWGYVTLTLSGTFAALLACKDWIMMKLFGVHNG